MWIFDFLKQLYNCKIIEILGFSCEIVSLEKVCTKILEIYFNMQRGSRLNIT